MHTDVGHRCVGAKVNGRIVPLHYTLKSGDIVEVLTSKAGARPVARLAERRARPRALATRSASGSRSEQREDLEQKGRDSLAAGARSARAAAPEDRRPRRCSPAIIREMGFKKAEDFYVAHRRRQGAGRPGRRPRCCGRLKTAEVVESDGRAHPSSRRSSRGRATSRQLRHRRRGRGRTPTCWCAWRSAARRCPATRSRGYISLGRGVTIHRDDCPNVRALDAQRPSASTPVELGRTTDARSRSASRSRVESWDRPRLLEDVARTFAEHGANIVEYGGHRGRPDGAQLVLGRGRRREGRCGRLLSALRNVDAVFDAYRVTPGG